MHDRVYIAPFSEIGREDVARAGGKGANLGALGRWGFRVPPGFCVLAHAYRAVVHSPAVATRLREELEGLQPDDVPALEAASDRIRRAIASCPLPDGLQAALAEAYRALGAHASGPEPLVAVRSSVGTRDLRRSSFPGQMDTYHHVRGSDEVIRLVRSCWASAFNAHAVRFRQEAAIDHFDVFVAPLVQLMVPSDIAGVLFTADPVTHDRRHLVINAAPGLGEAVVGGRLSPDHYRVDKATGIVLDARPGHKPFRLMLDEDRGHGVREEEIPESARRVPCLEPDPLARLARTAIEIEERYGVPQDVEWAFHEGVLYILQSRPISTWDADRAAAAEAQPPPFPASWTSEFDTHVPDTDPPTYTSANISEVLPGVLTPLSVAGLKVLDWGFYKPNAEIGLVSDPFPPEPNRHLFVGLFYGRAHLNLSRFRQIMSQIPGGSTSEFDRPLPETEGDGVEDTPVDLRHRARNLLRLPILAHRFLRMRRRVLRELPEMTAHAWERRERLRARPLSDYSPAEFLAEMEGSEEDGRKATSLHIENSQFAVFAYEMLRKLTRRYLDDDTGVFAARLVTGLGSLESARPSFEIHGLYRMAARSPSLRALFLDSEAGTVLERLRNSRCPDCAAFLEELSAFLYRYGYRSVFEAEVSLPSWEEDPSFVFRVIQDYLRAAHVADPAAIERRQSAERRTAEAEALGRLGRNPLRRALFLRVLADARRFLAAREGNKALLMLGIHEAKRAFHEMARRFEAMGAIRREDDFYFLTQEEIRQLAADPEGIGRGELEGRVARRRRIHAWNLQVRLPDVFTGRPDPLPAREAEAPTEPPAVLRGLPVSPGRVTGKARVILDPRQDAHMDAGEILVAPVTDAAWTPLFLMASGLVVDVGGLLSHGSIVAREYGIPGVLNVIDGTKRIRTGQVITVDGDRGEVHLEPAGYTAA